MDQPELDKKLNQLIDEAKNGAERKKWPFWLRFLMSFFWNNLIVSHLTKNGQVSLETLERLKSLRPEELLGLDGKVISSSTTITMHPIATWTQDKNGQEVFSKNFSENSVENLPDSFAEDDFSRLVKTDRRINNLWPIFIFLGIGFIAALIIYKIILSFLSFPNSLN